jgi:hypothetical protein
MNRTRKIGGKKSMKRETLATVTEQVRDGPVHLF